MEKMWKKLLIGAVVLVALLFGAKMLIRQETVEKDFSASSEITHQKVAQKTDDMKNFFSPLASVVTTKELTPVQKKLQELGFYPDKFQSIQVKTKN